MAVDAVAATELAPLLRRKKISPVELTRLYLARAKRLNPLLNAYITLSEEQALADAARAEREIHQNLYRGPQHGIPFSIKDNLSCGALKPRRDRRFSPIGFPTSMPRRYKG
jgi:aspartyl-tRNA(Asn)/glutamyl-tRNA(Gln) amidotransferase subunit A